MKLSTWVIFLSLFVLLSITSPTYARAESPIIEQEGTWAGGPLRCRIYLDSSDVYNSLALKMVTEVDEEDSYFALHLWNDDSGNVGDIIHEGKKINLIEPKEDEWGEGGFIRTREDINGEIKERNLFYGYHSIDLPEIDLKRGYYWIGVSQIREAPMALNVGVYDDRNQNTYSESEGGINRRTDWNCYYMLKGEEEIVECTERYFTCPDGTEVLWCGLIDGVCKCIDSPELQCLESEWYRIAYVRCYDSSERYFGSSTSCERVETWKQYADRFCTDKCSRDNCGVETLSFRGVCSEQEESFDVNVNTNKHFYEENEIVKINLEVRGNINLDELNVRDTGVTNPRGYIERVSMALVGGIGQVCVVKDEETYCPEKDVGGYMFVGYYTASLQGEHFISAGATHGNDLKTSETKFEVIVGEEQEVVDLDIRPKEQKTNVGQPVEYNVRIRDNQFSDGGEVVFYYIIVRGLPFDVEYPPAVRVPKGGTEIFTIKVYPSSTRIREVVERGVVVDREREEGTISPEREIVPVTGRTAVAPNVDTTLYERGVFRFSVSARERDNSQNYNSDNAVLYVEYEIESPIPPIVPPTPPTVGEDVEINLERGWNMINFPGSLSSISSNCPGEMYGFVYLSDENRYVTIREAEEIMGKTKFMKYVTVNSFWVYAREPCSINTRVSNFATYSGMVLDEGWNMLGVTRDMVGETLNSINKDCVFTGVYSWDPLSQDWKVLSSEALIRTPYNGLLVRTEERCSFEESFIRPPSFPGEVI